MVQFIAPAVLLIGILAGIWLNRRDYESLRRELTETMDRRFSDMERRFSALDHEINRQFVEVGRRLTLIESDQKQFFVVTGKMEGRIDEIAKR